MVMLKLNMGVERNSWTALWIVMGTIGLVSILALAASGGISSDPTPPGNYTNTDEVDTQSVNPDRVAQLEQDFNEGDRP